MTYQDYLGRTNAPTAKDQLVETVGNVIAYTSWRLNMLASFPLPQLILFAVVAGVAIMTVMLVSRMLRA